jgi:spore maturation protein CgeB
LTTEAPGPASSLVLVGNPQVVHVAAHLSTAATDLGHSVALLNSDEAFAGNRWVRKFSWHLRGHRPARLREFSRQVVEACHKQQAPYMLATGIAPVDDAALGEIGRLGATRVSYLTDDPWNPRHRAPWFMNSLRHYDWVFSTRKSNLAELREHGCPRVSYLPFAYAPHVHCCDLADRSATNGVASPDVFFAGGADPDRVPLIAMLIRNGFQVALYGGYWDRYRATRRAARGHADPETLRRAIGAAKVTLCLVRRANRDGNSMRSFEFAAMGACMLAEYTDEHLEILGDDGDAVVYFRSPAEMIDRLQWLLAHDAERRRLAAAVRARITTGRNTYRDRLETMLAVASVASRACTA